MKPSSIKSLLLVSALFTTLHAQDAPAKVREIEQKVLQKQYQTAVQALAELARGAGETGASADLIGKRLQWLAMVDAQVEAGGKASAANPEDMTRNADKLNQLAWDMITSPDAAKRHPEIALKLADIALELCGGNLDLKPNLLDTKARALFLLGRHDEAIAEQEKAVAAEVFAEEKSGFEATLALYRKKELPVISSPDDERKPPNDHGAPPPTTGVAYIAEKLRRIIIPRIDFEDVTVEEAVDFLRLRAMELDKTELDPARKGLNFVIRRPRPGAAGAADAGAPPAAPGAESDPGALRVKELRLRNVPLAVALKYICDQAKLRYKVDDFAVTLVPLSEVDKEIFTRTFRVPPNFRSLLDSGAREDAVTDRSPILELLKSNGIHFGEGSSVTLTTNGTLMVTNTPTELDKLEQLIAAVMPEGER